MGQDTFAIRGGKLGVRDGKWVMRGREVGIEGAGSGDRVHPCPHPLQWNALPGNVACSHDLDCFKVAMSKLQHSRP